jgi:hypothetical protein
MNGNSFQLKGWAVTLVSALLAVYVSAKNEYFVLVAIVPALIMWCLDSYYLMQERRFRELYNDVAGISDEPKELKEFEMRPDLYIERKCSFYSSFASPTIFWLYFLMTAGLIALFLALNTSN